ncbi:MAG: 3-hydroxyacyl-CoA dehydrogenase NAD-binding domain-containing protein, partial [Bryobacteraceae bacterium]
MRRLRAFLFRYTCAEMPKLERAAVLGAGTMGARIAAQFANAGIPVLLLDVASEGD